MTTFVFCHGFGFTPHFWKHLAPYFAYEKCIFINLGYFEKEFIPSLHEQEIIGIGHSLGFLKLSKLYQNFKCLIGLNSFNNFLGNELKLNKKRTLELRALERSFFENSLDTLGGFYERCGVPELISPCFKSDLNTNKIHADLEFLKKKYTLPTVPILVMNTDDDLVVPPEIIKDNFYSHSEITLSTINQAKHGLGFIKPTDVYKNIMDFLDDQFK